MGSCALFFRIFKFFISIQSSFSMRFLIAIFISSTLSLTANAIDKQEAPEDVVSNIVMNHTKPDSKMFTCPPSALMEARCTKKYVSIWRSECELSHEGESGNLLLYGQGLIDVLLDSMTSHQSKKSAKVLANISYTEGNVRGEPRSFGHVVFSLKKEDGTWKVDEHKLIDAKQTDFKRGSNTPPHIRRQSL